MTVHGFLVHALPFPYVSSDFAKDVQYIGPLRILPPQSFGQSQASIPYLSMSRCTQWYFTCAASVPLGSNLHVCSLLSASNDCISFAKGAPGTWFCRVWFTCDLATSVGSHRLPAATHQLFAGIGLVQSLQCACVWLSPWCCTSTRKVGLSAQAVPRLLVLLWRLCPEAPSAVQPALRPRLQEGLDKLLSTCGKAS